MGKLSVFRVHVRLGGRFFAAQRALNIIDSTGKPVRVWRESTVFLVQKSGRNEMRVVVFSCLSQRFHATHIFSYIYHKHQPLIWVNIPNRNINDRFFAQKITPKVDCYLEVSSKKWQHQWLMWLGRWARLQMNIILGPLKVQVGERFHQSLTNQICSYIYNIYTGGGGSD